MERVVERCCGLDVHKKTVHVRTFGTTTADLRRRHLFTTLYEEAL